MRTKNPLVSSERNRETVHLWFAVWIMLVLSLYRLVSFAAEPLKEHLSAHTHWPVAELIVNCLFFWLLALLWLAYRRWRDSVFRQQELERVIGAISPDVLMVVNANRMITMCNDAIAPMFGYETDEILGKRSDLLYSDRRVTGERREIYTYLERVGFHVGVATGRRKDDSTFPIELITGNIRGQEGVVILIRDITKRKKAEDALRLSEKRFTEFMKHLPACAFIRNPEGEILYVNNCYLEMLGDPGGGDADRSEPSAQAPARFASDDSIVAESGEKVHRMEETACDGKRRVFDLFKFPIPNDAGTPFVGGIAVDITERIAAAEERRRLEVQMLQSQKLESLGLLGGGIAHDFNNLLAGILGYADLAAAEASDNPAIRRYLDEVIAASKRAADLCNQLLAYSGQGRFMIEIVDPAKTVREMEHLLKVSVSKKAMLEFDLADDLPGVECDTTQLRQVVMNLAINASDALGDRPGIIRVSVNLKACDHEMLAGTFLGEHLPEGDYVLLSIRDDGCGMDAQTIQRMFDPFFSTKFTGRGLGLAAVIGIVRGHGGAINVTSEPGHGTVFEILLPATEKPTDEQKAPDDDAADAWTGSGCVLVVDDEHYVRDIAENMLRRMGFEVTSAKNGAEALEILKKRGNTFRAALLDTTMPMLSGSEVYKGIRDAGICTPVILSSGYNNEERLDTKDITDALFLQKPYEMRELRRTMRKLLDSADANADSSESAEDAN